MNAKKFSDAMNELDTKYVDEALNYKKKAKKPGWVKWGAMAACFAVIAVLGVGVFQSGLFGNKTDIATLDNGNEIIFVKSETAGSSIDIDGTITTPLSRMPMPRPWKRGTPPRRTSTPKPPLPTPCTIPSPPTSRPSYWRSAVSPPPPSTFPPPTRSCGTPDSAAVPWPSFPE